MKIETSDLTVIIPSFNMQDMTERAVESVLQNADDLAILVVDDASKPPIKLPPRLSGHNAVKLIRHETNLGAACARNTGLAHATTPWISFLDADDVLLPGTLQERLAFVSDQTAALKDPSVSIARTIYGCGWVEAAQSGDNPGRVRVPEPAASLEDFAGGCWYCPGSALIFHRSVFEGAAGVFSQTLRRLEDFEWGLRFASHGGRLIVQDKAGVAIKPSNRVSLADIEKAEQQILHVHEAMRKSHPAAWKSACAYLELEKATAAWREGRKVKAGSALLQSLAHKPRMTRHLSPGWNYRSLS